MNKNNKPVYAIKNSDSEYFIGYGKWDKQIRKAKLYHATNWAEEVMNDPRFDRLDLKIVKVIIYEGGVEMTAISDIIEGLEEEETLYCGVCTGRNSTCSMDCDYYISGNYGSECALHIVMETLQSRLNGK